MRGQSVKALLLRCLLAAVLIGPTISFVSDVVSFHRATKYEPPLTEAEFHQMGNMTVNEIESTMSKRRINVSRWAWYSDSIHDAYFWKQIAKSGIVPGSGVFLACAWVGWMEKRKVGKLKTTT